MALKRLAMTSAFVPQKATRRETAPRNPAILLLGRYLPFFAFGAAFAGAAAALGAAFAAGLAAGFFSAMVLPLAFQY
jgi:hypothetical protein